MKDNPFLYPQTALRKTSRLAIISAIFVIFFAPPVCWAKSSKVVLFEFLFEEGSDMARAGLMAFKYFLKRDPTQRDHAHVYYSPDLNDYFSKGNFNLQKKYVASVRACINQNPNSIVSVTIIETSGSKEFDELVKRFVSDSKYHPGVNEQGQPLLRSCINRRIRYENSKAKEEKM